ITMKVLTMQLNSITIMDLIAYGGAALGVIMAASQFRAGKVSLAGCLLIILLAADFFIPMRQLGSFFHIAMNGMAASDKIFRLLDLQEPERKATAFPAACSIKCDALQFSYEENSEVLHGVNMIFKESSFTSIVGESGCGKSTIAAILMGRNKGYSGSVKIGGVELREIEEAGLMKNITYISHQSYLFKGTVRENLLMGKPGASDDELWEALERAKLADFMKCEKGLDTFLAEKGANLSGGQCQRLALARALLHDSPVYIFDEATSNIDVESENDIMREIHTLAGRKTVILISHRLANVTDSDNIYVMEKGSITECGRHEELLKADGVYAKLWNVQQNLENYGKDGGKIA
ncbi:MAG: ATP-binding cassette domain-containing protein, partial [Lachnospiraceae bacterium]|nr:ATP-binding cassette domain-containing protein [Lachnospiraceae bacterium]